MTRKQLYKDKEKTLGYVEILTPGRDQKYRCTVQLGQECPPLYWETPDQLVASFFDTDLHQKRRETFVSGQVEQKYIRNKQQQQQINIKKQGIS